MRSPHSTQKLFVPGAFTGCAHGVAGDSASRMSECSQMSVAAAGTRPTSTSCRTPKMRRRLCGKWLSANHVRESNLPECAGYSRFSDVVSGVGKAEAVHERPATAENQVRILFDCHLNFRAPCTDLQTQ